MWLSSVRLPLYAKTTMDRTISHRLIRLSCSFFCASLLLAEASGAQTLFTEVTEEIGAPRFGARSTAFGDYDNDGWPDMFLAEHWGPQIALLHNDGDGRFTDRTATIQADISPYSKGGGAIFGDYDNDGDLDLFVPVRWASFGALNELLRNDRGVLRGITREAGLTDSLVTDNAIWLDYDRDGDIDLYTGNLESEENCVDPGVRNKLYRNNGDSTFTDVTQEAGLAVVIRECRGGSNGGMAAGDFNDDGWPDLYVGAWRSANRLFLNDGQGRFQDATTGEIGDVGGEASGIGVGDIDDDGDLDIFQAAGGSWALRGRSPMLLNLGEGGT